MGSSRTTRRKRPLAALLLAALAIPTLAYAQTGSVAARPATGLPFAVATAPSPRPMGPPEATPGAEQLEQLGRHTEAARAFETLARLRPDDPEPLWRAARAWMREAETRPADPEARLELYERALAQAERSRDRDADCGECCLYEFAARGRIISVEGLSTAALHVRTLAELAETCRALPVSYVGPDGEPELANLHYALSGFYRAIPDGKFASLWIGARGDARRAVEHGRLAVAAHPVRDDYRVELGAGLLCLASRNDDPEARSEGLGWLRGVTQHPPASHPRDVRARRGAALLRESPDRACDFTPDGFVGESR